MRYTTKPTRLYIADDCIFDDVRSRETMTVIQDEQEPQKTGLLDASGEPLYRMPEKRHAGFYKLSED